MAAIVAERHGVRSGFSCCYVKAWEIPKIPSLNEGKWGYFRFLACLLKPIVSRFRAPLLRESPSCSASTVPAPLLLCVLATVRSGAVAALCSDHHCCRFYSAPLFCTSAYSCYVFFPFDLFLIFLSLFFIFSFCSYLIYFSSSTSNFSLLLQIINFILIMKIK